MKGRERNKILHTHTHTHTHTHIGKNDNPYLSYKTRRSRKIMLSVLRSHQSNTFRHPFEPVLRWTCNKPWHGKRKSKNVPLTVRTWLHLLEPGPVDKERIVTTAIRVRTVCSSCLRLRLRDKQPLDIDDCRITNTRVSVFVCVSLCINTWSA